MEGGGGEQEAKVERRGRTGQVRPDAEADEPVRRALRRRRRHRHHHHRHHYHRTRGVKNRMAGGARGDRPSADHDGGLGRGARSRTEWRTWTRNELGGDECARRLGSMGAGWEVKNRMWVRAPQGGWAGGAGDSASSERERGSGRERERTPHRPAPRHTEPQGAHAARPDRTPPPATLARARTLLWPAPRARSPAQ